MSHATLHISIIHRHTQWHCNTPNVKLVTLLQHLTRETSHATRQRHTTLSHVTCLMTHMCMPSYVMRRALRIKSHTPTASRYASHVVAENQTSSKSSLTRQTSHATRQRHTAFWNVAHLMSQVCTGAWRRHTSVTRHASCITLHKPRATCLVGAL